MIDMLFMKVYSLRGKSVKDFMEEEIIIGLFQSYETVLDHERSDTNV